MKLQKKEVFKLYSMFFLFFFVKNLVLRFSGQKGSKWSQVFQVVWIKNYISRLLEWAQKSINACNFSNSLHGVTVAWTLTFDSIIIFFLGGGGILCCWKIWKQWQILRHEFWTLTQKIFWGEILYRGFCSKSGRKSVFQVL